MTARARRPKLSDLLASDFKVAIWVPSQMRREFARREHKTTMFRITRETVRRLSLGEILLLIAMNLETSRLPSENRVDLTIGRL